MFLRIVFNELGDFTQGTIRVLGSKSDGWNKPAELNIADLPATQKKTFNSMVTAFKEKGEPWVASQCWVYPATDRSVEPEVPAIELILEAKHDETGAITTFPGVILSDSAYVKLFNALVK
jgi:hypothetical protein